MKISFDTISAAADQKFDKLELEVLNETGDVETVEFGNPARLSQEQRAEFRAALDEMTKERGEADEEQADEVGVLRGLMASVCISGNGELVFNLLGDDQALWSELLNTYFKAVKVGEASASQN